MNDELERPEKSKKFEAGLYFFLEVENNEREKKR